MKIVEYVKKRIDDFEQETIEIVPGYRFNQRKLLNQIELYFNSKYETGEFDSQGFKKFFYNIVQFPCDVESKATDIDTKDYIFIPEEDSSGIDTWILKKEFTDWIKENKWGKKLNDIVRDRPKYGSIVVKKVKNTIRQVNIHNLVNDQTVEHLWQGPVIENHVMTPDELRSMPYDAKAIQEVIDIYNKEYKENYICVREFYGYANIKDVDYNYEGKDYFGYFMVVLGAVEKVKETKDGETYSQGKILFWKELKAPKDDRNLGDFPYRESHRRKVLGRWLGIGKVEELIDPQIRLNELENIKSKGLYWSSAILFQTRDTATARNLLEDVLNGEILRTESEITPINVNQMNLTAFTQEEQRWDKNIQERSFSFESETGQTLPSGTPFRLGALLSQKSGGFFSMMREDIGLFLVDLFFECQVPLFKKDKRKRHTLMLPLDDKEMEDKLNEYTNFLLQQEILAGAIPPSLEERRNSIKTILVQRRFLPVDIPDGFYDNIKFRMKLVITDEEIDIGQKLESLNNVLTILASNPAVLQDEATRKILFSSMELAGLNPGMMGLYKPMPQAMVAPEEMTPAKGSITAPSGNMPVPSKMMNVNVRG